MNLFFWEEGSQTAGVGSDSTTGLSPSMVQVSAVSFLMPYNAICLVP